MAALYEPDPRRSSFFSSIKNELYVWGGHNRNIPKSDCVEVFYSLTETWGRKSTTGVPPLGFYHGASAEKSDRYLYTYGGYDQKNNCTGSLHCLDTTSSRWIILSPPSADGPMVKVGSRMVVHENILVLFGGYGIPSQPGSDILKNTSFTDGRGWTNSLYKFDLNERTWSSPTVTGEKPPPSAHFTLTQLCPNKSILFGGSHHKFTNGDAYILDLVRTMCWTKLSPREGKDRPVGRSNHAAACLDYDGDNPQLVITGGLDRHFNVLTDLWVLDIPSIEWNEVIVPRLPPRFDHCASALSYTSERTDINDIVLFGGCSEVPRNNKTEEGLFCLASTTILRFEKKVCPSTPGCLAAPTHKEWVFIDVADSTQRGTSERVKEKIVKLEEISKRRAVEAERKAQNLEWKLEKLERERDWLVERSEIIIKDENKGRGGSGEVNVAEFRGITVAAKVFYEKLQPSFYTDSVMREINIASRVRHPNLVQFIGASMDKEIVILMELMPTSLHQYILTTRPSTQFCIAVSLDVAKALNYLHLMQPDPIIHRDISSVNVLLERMSEQCWRAKVTDYGSATLLKEVRTNNPGSLAYSAPEAKDCARHSPKMDIFSFGVLLIEMCTAQLPEATNREAMINSIHEQKWVKLIRCCTRQDQEQRPTATQILFQLKTLKL